MIIFNKKFVIKRDDIKYILKNQFIRDLIYLAVLALRLTSPSLPRPFRCPMGKTVAFFGAILSLGLMLSMPTSSWWRLGIWLLAGLLLFFLYAWFSGRLGGGGD